MKMRKIAKDAKGKVLEKGDIILLYENSNPVVCVIRDMEQPMRDEFPKLEVVKIITDWRGQNPKVESSTVDFDHYKGCYVVPPENLRDDVPVYMKAKEIHDEHVLDDMDPRKA
jgi:hypothetical protein